MMRQLGDITLLEALIRKTDGFKSKTVIVTTKEAASSCHLPLMARNANLEAEIVEAESSPEGAVASALLAHDHISEDEDLLILAADEYLHCDYLALVQEMKSSVGDLGLVWFASTHPRYSYISTEEGRVKECQEGFPVSTSALATFYWFRTGKIFLDQGMNLIRSGIRFQTKFYLSGLVNQCILSGVDIFGVEIESRAFVPLKDETDVWRDNFNWGVQF